MDQIKYGFGAIAAASGDIQATSGRINSLLADLKAHIAPMAATWEGASAEAYAAAQARWDRAAEELNQVLGSIARVVAQGNDRMAEVNRAAAASWG